MHRLYVEQKMMSLRGRFAVTDEHGGPLYQVEGSFLQIPKSFTISDVAGRPRARVWKQPVSWLPRFYVEIEGVQVATIQKSMSFLRPRYSVEGPGLTVAGNVWDMRFELLQGGTVVGRVDKRWTLRDRYAIEIERPEDELLVLGIVLAIDYVKASQQATSNA
jgi:uncharacterized protein YxjI